MKEKICNYFKDFLSLQVEGEKNMKDEEIINLYLNKSENAIYETEKKYGKYCECIAYNILQDKEDTKECINDAFLNVWNAIPP